jgi:MOSC domain-containing protein YiiM
MHLTRAELEAGLPHIRRSPADSGTLELIVRRPAVDEREVLEVAELDPSVGLVGDTWCERPSRRSDDGGPHPEMQLNIMNARAAALLAGSPDRWALAGDQLYIDLDLSDANLPAGTRLAVGAAVIEITPQPHNGCAKFAERFGQDAVRFVNSPAGKELHLRGVNAKVVQGGAVERGATVSKVT